MRFLADEGVDRLIVSRLREAGHDVRYVPEFAPSSADIDILAISLSEDRILITFHGRGGGRADLVGDECGEPTNDGGQP